MNTFEKFCQNILQVAPWIIFHAALILRNPLSFIQSMVPELQSFYFFIISETLVTVASCTKRILKVKSETKCVISKQVSLLILLLSHQPGCRYYGIPGYYCSGWWGPASGCLSSASRSYTNSIIGIRRNLNRARDRPAIQSLLTSSRKTDGKSKNEQISETASIFQMKKQMWKERKLCLCSQTLKPSSRGRPGSCRRKPGIYLSGCFLQTGNTSRIPAWISESDELKKLTIHAAVLVDVKVKKIPEQSASGRASPIRET